MKRRDFTTLRILYSETGCTVCQSVSPVINSIGIGWHVGHLTQRHTHTHYKKHARRGGGVRLRGNNPERDPVQFGRAQHRLDEVPVAFWHPLAEMKMGNRQSRERTLHPQRGLCVSGYVYLFT